MNDRPDRLEEPIDLQRMIAVASADDGQRVERGGVLPEERQAAHHVIEGVATLLVDAIAIIHLPRAVDAQTNEKVLLAQELAPFVVEQRAVGLQRVVNLLPAGVLPLKRNGLAKEIDAEQRRLASLPGKADLGHVLPVDVLPDVRFENVVGHTPAGLVGVERSFSR